ncbi:MAG: LL-diaminopimelate aminotransferase [Bacteroidaceae bacterium]|nr:LL-diaminopimelate aminotransferase [Bacteroidaceae bacterium]MCF0189260.1 LL-diaminopimelate aminotransferase [Bacteroidaceae bacterium]
MSIINQHFLRLSDSYLFSAIAQKVREYKAANPDRRVISLGIGDVTRPLPPACVEAMHRAVSEMSAADTFRGYGPEQGYGFLRQAIIDHDFAPRGVRLSLDEVFISDGAKSDCGNIGDILSTSCTVGMTDPVYPVYVDSNVMGGRGSQITYLPVSAANGFLPQIPDRHIDVIYLCYPNNPTGMTISREQLQKWVDYARREGSIILYDAAYEAYIRHDGIPHSIYEIEGAKECAIELRSFSKTAGFTGVRCGCTIVPKALTRSDDNGAPVSLNHLWNRRQCTKFNGTSYITQRAAEAIYTPEGQRQVQDTIGYYMGNAAMMRRHLTALGFEAHGGEDAPYIWLRCPDGTDSWSFFDVLLRRLSIVTTPGVGFGPSGEGFVRLTAFGRREDCDEAMQRFSQI